ncbi:MAG: aminotransferase class I/II-fold pyridoxal phosphate-dependent enzyme [Pseudomonadota bacterium]
MNRDIMKPEVAPIGVSSQLGDVRYEIRGALARRAQELDRQGYDILHLNIGNPGRFGFRTPETMRLAIIENLAGSEAYCHQKGIFPAREAVVMQQQNRGVMDVSVDDVMMGNGVSELIDLSLRALLSPGDEVLVPSPDYPLWTAAVALNGGDAVHYPCPRDGGFEPDLEALEALITPRTRALVVINPNNPTGAVYGRQTLEALAELAERHQLVLMSDEIYDQVLFDDAPFVPMATLVSDTLCITFSGLSKVYRACGYRVGWSITSGNRESAGDYLIAMELLASLRLCANVPGQWAVQTALGGYQSVRELVRPGGRLYESRQACVDAVAASRWLQMDTPRGALYGFPRVVGVKGFDDHQFAMELLEKGHVLVVPGSSFHYPEQDTFRLTFLPDAKTLGSAFERIDRQLTHMATGR